MMGAVPFGVFEPCFDEQRKHPRLPELESARAWAVALEQENAELHRILGRVYDMVSDAVGVGEAWQSRVLSVIEEAKPLDGGEQ
jgi:hypothetical protein